jgi:hypothetical protein
MKRRLAYLPICLLTLTPQAASLPAGASAATGSVPGHRCAPLYPRITKMLKAFGASCTTAHMLEHRLTEGGAGSENAPGWVAGRQWRFYIDSWAPHAHGIFVAIPGLVYVQLTTWDAEPQL